MRPNAAMAPVIRTGQRLNRYGRNRTVKPKVRNRETRRRRRFRQRDAYLSSLKIVCFSVFPRGGNASLSGFCRVRFGIARFPAVRAHLCPRDIRRIPKCASARALIIVIAIGLGMARRSLARRISSIMESARGTSVRLIRPGAVVSRTGVSGSGRARGLM